MSFEVNSLKSGAVDFDALNVPVETKSLGSLVGRLCPGCESTATQSVKAKDFQDHFFNKMLGFLEVSLIQDQKYQKIKIYSKDKNLIFWVITFFNLNEKSIRKQKKHRPGKTKSLETQEYFLQELIFSFKQVQNGHRVFDESLYLLLIFLCENYQLPSTGEKLIKFFDSVFKVDHAKRIKSPSFDSGQGPVALPRTARAPRASKGSDPTGYFLLKKLQKIVKNKQAGNFVSFSLAATQGSGQGRGTENSSNQRQLREKRIFAFLSGVFEKNGKLSIKQSKKGLYSANFKLNLDFRDKVVFESLISLFQEGSKASTPLLALPLATKGKVHESQSDQIVRSTKYSKTNKRINLEIKENFPLGDLPKGSFPTYRHAERSFCSIILKKIVTYNCYQFADRFFNFNLKSLSLQASPDEVQGHDFVFFESFSQNNIFKGDFFKEQGLSLSEANYKSSFFLSSFIHCDYVPCSYFNIGNVIDCKPTHAESTVRTIAEATPRATGKVTVGAARVSVMSSIDYPLIFSKDILEGKDLRLEQLLIKNNFDFKGKDVVWPKL